MAEKTALPTDEEVNKMKFGKLVRLLREFGMTGKETDEMEKEDDARVALKKRIRDIQATTAATSRRPGQITEMLLKAMSTNKEKREGLRKIYDSIYKLVDSLDDDDKQKMKEFFGQDLQVVLKDVRAFLQSDDCPILVVGDASSGKSSLLNLLLGKDILPVSHLASTLCFVRHGEIKKATFYLKGCNPTDGTREHTIDLEDTDRIKKEELPYSEVQKVVIEWPLEYLQSNTFLIISLLGDTEVEPDGIALRKVGGICLVDGPDIKETDEMDEVVAGVVSSTCAFIYGINSAIPLNPAPSSTKDGPIVDELTDGLSCLFKLCQKHKWGDVFQFNLESTMFVCNKWDLKENVKKKEAVKKDYLKKLRGHFPELRDDQVFFLSCDKAVGSTGQLSADFERPLDGLDDLLPKSLQHKLELQYQHVEVVLKKASQYIRLKLHSANRKQKLTRKAKEALRHRKNFNQHAEQVKRTLDETLTAVQREAENQLKTFLKDEALKSSVYQKILNDFPEVDDSENGSARLIKAIANEIESQLKSNPGASAFNQCIREADIRLREQFQTKYGKLLEQHNKVIEEMLDISLLPSKSEQLGKISIEAFFLFASFFLAPYRLATILDPTLGKTISIWDTLGLAKKLQKIMLRPDNRKEYIMHFTNQVFDVMTTATAIKSAVKEHLKRPIQYHNACKNAIPKLQQVDQQLDKTETRPEDEITRSYEQRLEKIIQLVEELCGFYITDIKKHEFDLSNTIWKPLALPVDDTGSHGRVYSVEVNKDGGTFTAAMKTPRQLISGETNSIFVREAENLRKLKGRHVVEFFGTYRGETDGTRPCLGLVMEYCPKTLDAEMFGKKENRHRENSPAWWKDNPEKQAAAFSYTKKMAVQLCEGLKHIHDAGYMHRDLKLSNVLVSSEGVVKLADLGSSKSENAYARTIEGTGRYAAPEVLEQNKYNRSADMYSMGVILLEMWYGRIIYDSPRDREYESKFDESVPLNVGQQLPLPNWHGRARPIPEWRKLINLCLRKDPGQRPTAETCKNRIARMSLQSTQTASGRRGASGRWGAPGGRGAPRRRGAPGGRWAPGGRRAPGGGGASGGGGNSGGRGNSGGQGASAFHIDIPE